MYYDLVEILGREYFFRGRMYNSYNIERKSTTFNKPIYSHEYVVRDDLNRSFRYGVNVKNNGATFYEYHCTCHEFEKNGMCKHVAAVLANEYYYLIRNEYVDDLIVGERILSKFNNKVIDIKNNIRRKVNLKCELIFSGSNVLFRLSIGLDKLYVITDSKLNSFLHAIKNKEKMEFGKNFTFDGNLNYFDEEDMKIINFLLDYRHDAYSKNNPYLLSNREFNYLLEILKNRDIYIKDYGKINNIIYGMPTSYHLSLSDNYTITIDDFSNYHLLTDNCKYILYNKNLYILSNEEKRLINIMVDNSLDKVIFSKEKIDNFKNGLFNDIKKNIIVDDNIKEVVIPKKPEINLYFDIKNYLKCKLELDYNGNKINYFDKMESFRSIDDEEIVKDDLINNGFMIDKDYFILDDDDKIYDFIKEKLVDFNNKYHVFLDKKLENTKFIETLNIKNKFSIGEDNILSYGFNIDEVDKDELDNLFKALRLKKKYYRLKNDKIVNLLDDDLQEMNDILENLNIKNGELIDGEVEVAKYRAIYMDSIKDKYHNIDTNNLFDEFITNFKKYQKSKIKFNEFEENTLRDYQKDGVKWLYTIYKCDLGGILADEMGLGKTLQTICLIRKILEEKNDSKILIVSPTALVYNWKKEFDKFAPNLKYVMVSDNKKIRKNIFENQDNYNIFITSYGLIANDNDEYEKMNFELCVIDEGQKIKNYKANMTREVKKIKAKCKISLTGTPIENNLTELWSIFDFIMPGYLNNIHNFNEKYSISNIDDDNNKEILKNLKNLITPFILRRKKSDVLKSLPDKIEKNLYVELDSKQKLLYAKEVKETKERIEELVRTGGFLKSKMEILSLLTRLREICIDPKVIYENYDGGSIKMETIIDVIKENISNNHKMLIFSSFKRILDNLQDLLKQNNINSYMIDGSVKGTKRVEMVDSFNNDDTPCFLITLKAGGTGLNLIGADTVIHLDIWWNPQVENQATDRAHRIGQKKNVSVLKIICKGTIEERIIELQEKKKYLSDNLIENNDNAGSISNLREEDIKKLLSFSNEE